MLKTGIIDFHTHAFPDEIAPKAMAALTKAADVKAYADGTINDLLRSMDRAGIEKSVIANIATKPSQFEPIIKWSAMISSDRIVPFASVHPNDPARIDNIKRIKDAGLKGIKLHPFYQDFFLDEPRMYEMYAIIQELGLVCMVHTGFDIAFERIRRCDPARIIKITQDFPGLKFVSTHFGAWEEWVDVKEVLLGKPVYAEISLSLEFLDPKVARTMLLTHKPEYLIFGSDSPWADQQNALRLLEELDLDEKLYDLMLRENAMRLLGE